MRRAALDGVPRLGWAEEPTPIEALPELAEVLGLGWLGVKRDDLIPDLIGGTKVRKLDFVLAGDRLRDAPRWRSVGAIGSGHLATLTAAAEQLDRRLSALCFFEPLGPWVEEDLAFTASGPTELRYHATRSRLALRHPLVVTGRGAGVIAPGATDPAGMLGMVRAGLELAEQLHDGALPSLDRVYLPLGTGGSAAGLSVGLGLGGARPAIHAVSAVERVFARDGRLRHLVSLVIDALRASTRELPAIEPAAVEIDHRFVGAGYGHPTVASLREGAAFGRLGLPLEPVYGGKAMAALRADAPSMRGQRVLLWLTGHRRPLPHAPDWESRLPRDLQRTLRLARAGRLGRRKWIARGAMAAGAIAVGARLGLHRDVEGFEGQALFGWEGAVLAAAVEAIVPEAPGRALPGGITADAVASNVDRYIVGMPPGTRAEIHGMLALVEHGTALGGFARRFTRLSPADRLEALSALSRRGGDLAQAAKGLRDLCYLGYYQEPAAWPALGYGGPWVRAAPTAHGRYDALCAAAGAVPPHAEGS